MTDSAQSASAVESVFHGLYRKSRAADFGLGEPEFEKVLAEAAHKYLPGNNSLIEIARLYDSLHLEELALARACASGSGKAWKVFLARYRAKLYELAATITRDVGTAHELADSLYADLYGVNSRDEHRVSKLATYMGKGSLEGWLRTVLAQEFVNRYRARKRLVSLEEQEERGGQFAAAHAEAILIADVRVERATDQALAALAAEDRFVLAAYFLDGRTLAGIARVMQVHESTISRKIEKLTRKLRKNIIDRLMKQGMDRRAAQEAMDVDVRDMAVDVRLRLAQETPDAAFNNEKNG